MPEFDHELFFDKNPARYACYVYDRCHAWWKSQEKRVQEDFDMAQGRDEYMQSKRDLGYSSLTVPLIYIVSEARTAAMWELMSREEPFFRYEPMGEGGFDRLAAEHKQTAMEHMRRDLRWNETIMDMFYACEWSSHAWLSIEAKEVKITPSSGLWVPRDMFGTTKLYPTFVLYAPGEIIMDGFQKDQSAITATAKRAWMSYHQLKTQFPKYVDKWLLKHAKRLEDSAYYNPNTKSQAGEVDNSAHVMFQGHDQPDAEWNSQYGFLVVELTMDAMFSDGSTRPVIYTFLPEIKNGPTPSDQYSYGFPLNDGQGVPFPYESVDYLNVLARGRRMPYTVDGKSTSDLLFSFQREISDSIATERDLDRSHLQPVTAVRSEMLADRDSVNWEPGSTWLFKNRGSDGYDYRLDDLVSQIQRTTPNRGYLTSTRQEMRALAELAGAAMEATTGAKGGDETLGKFQARARGGNNRISLVFINHAGTLITAVDMIQAIMAEAESVFMRPPLRASSETRGPGVFSKADILTPSRLGIPALEKYAERETAQVLWMTLGEVLTNNPAFAGNLPANVELCLDIMRKSGVSEQRAMEYEQLLYGGVMQAQMMAQQASMPPDLSQGQPIEQPQQQSPLLARAQGGTKMGAVL